MRYAEKLYRQMLLRGFNQQKLARLASVSDSEVSRILAGKSNPSLEYAFRLARALGVSLDYLADDGLDIDPTQTAGKAAPLESEILEHARELGARHARRLLETAVDLGYDTAIRRLLGADRKPVIEVGESAHVNAPIDPHVAQPIPTRNANSA